MPFSSEDLQNQHSVLTKMDGQCMLLAQKLQRSFYLKQASQYYFYDYEYRLNFVVRHLSKGGSISYTWNVIWSYAWHASYWQSYWSTMESPPKGKWNHWLNSLSMTHLLSRLPILLFMAPCRSRCLVSLVPNFLV